MVTAYSYQRVSTPPQAHGSGMARQSLDVAAWCAARGWTLDESLSLADPGKSAYKGDHLRRGALGRFLDLAQAGGLGPDPVLLVEAIDRLSRQEPLDALDTILGGLVRAGVAVVTLEDGATYSRETLKSDPSRLLVLVVRIQAAHDYSARLSRRISHAWNESRDAMKQGQLPRFRALKPGWIGDDGKANDYAPTIRRLIELVRTESLWRTAQILNAEGHRTSRGNPWTHGSVRQIVRSPGLIGTARIKSADGPVLMPDAWQPLCTPEEQQEILDAMRSRLGQEARLRADQVHWIGQGLTFCSCGGTASAHVTMKPNRVYRYVRCADRGQRFDCTPQVTYRLEVVTAALLTRLQPAQIEKLITRSRGADATAATLAVQMRQVDAAAQAVANTAKALESAALSGASLEVIVRAHQRAVDAHAAAVAAADETRRQRSAIDAGMGATLTAVGRLLHAFAQGIATAEQRRAVNSGLRRMGLKIVLDPAEPRMALAIGDAEPQWQPVDPLSLVHLQQGVTSVQLRRDGWAVVEDSGVLPDGTLWNRNANG